MRPSTLTWAATCTPAAWPPSPNTLNQGNQKIGNVMLRSACMWWYNSFSFDQHSSMALPWLGLGHESAVWATLLARLLLDMAVNLRVGAPPQLSAHVPRSWSCVIVCPAKALTFLLVVWKDGNFSLSLTFLLSSSKIHFLTSSENFIGSLCAPICELEKKNSEGLLSVSSILRTVRKSPENQDSLVWKRKVSGTYKSLR